MKKPPKKSRRAKADCPHHGRRMSKTASDWGGHSAPSHLGGQFDDAGYGPGGGFGFQIYHPQRGQ